MPSTNLTGKTKADLVVLAELSGLLTVTSARKMTKDQLLKFLSDADQKPQEQEAKETKSEKRSSAKPAASTKAKAVKAAAKPSKTAGKRTKTAASSKNSENQSLDEKAEPQISSEKAEEISAKTDLTEVDNAEADSTNAAADAKPKAVESKQPGKRSGNTARRTRTVKTKPKSSEAKQHPAEKQVNDADAISEDSTSVGVAAADAADSRKDENSPEQADKAKKSTRGRRKSVKTDDRAEAEAKASVSKSSPSDTVTGQSSVKVEADDLRSDDKSSVDRQSKQSKTQQSQDIQQKQPVQPRQEDRQDQGAQQNNNAKPDQSQQKQFAQQNQNGQRNAAQINKQKRPIVEQGEPVSGTLEIMADGYGFLRKDNYLQGTKDIYVPPQYIRRFNLKTGDYITGPGKLQRENDRYQALLYVKEVNGMPPDKMIRRPQFDRLTPIYPDERYRLETTRNELSTRIIDLAAPIGKGQRGMIVSPPKAGKTILLQKIANAISVNNPEVKLIVLLIDERPEEVTDMQRSIKGEVVYSTFDKTPENHVKVTELVLERAMRLVELKQDVVILLDSMTRLARAYNLTINPTGRTLSGGLDPGALYGPKRFFGAARNIENGGSLTIIATSLIETGSRMDEVIFEEFKGTGNMEVYLDRKLSEKRIFPAIDINRSGTRREELLMTEKELDAVWSIRKAFSQLDTSAVTETIINLLLKTQNNEHFISSINVSFNDKSIFDAMRGNRPAGNGQQNQNTMNNGTAR